MLPFVALGGAAVAGWLARQRIIQHFEADVAHRLPLGPDAIVQGAGSISLKGSTTHCVLLVHGFNDTPQSLAPLAQSLHARGWSVRAPLLPGHGRGLREAVQGKASEWLQCVRDEYHLLSAAYEKVVVCGQSMGGALAVRLASEHPELPALVLLAPYLGMPHNLQLKVLGARLLQPLIPYRRSVGGERSIHDPVARQEAKGLGVVSAGMLAQLRTIAASAAEVLPKVVVPTLYLQSREDNRITASDAERHFALLGAPIKEQRWVSRGGHIIAVDYCRDEVADQVHAWFARFAFQIAEP